MNRMLVLLLLALPFVPAAHAETQPSETRYVMEFGGQPAGSAVTRVVGERERR